MFKAFREVRETGSAKNVSITCHLQLIDLLRAANNFMQLDGNPDNLSPRIHSFIYSYTPDVTPHN